MKLTSTNVTLISINCLVIWLGMQATIAEGVDGKGRLTSTLLFLILMSNLVANRRFRSQFISKNSPLMIWAVWFFYAIINSILQYTPTERQSTALFIVTALILPSILIFAVASIKPNKVFWLFKSLQASFFLFFVMLILDAKLIGGRLVLERFDPNELSLYLYAMTFTVALNYFCGLQRYVTTLLALVPVIIFSILLGSRMGFAGVSLLMLGFLVTNRSGGNSIKRIAILLPLVLVVLFSGVNGTELGERLLSTASQTDDWADSPVEGSILKYYGDRGVYYVIGWQAFLDSPLFGIGLKNFLGNYYPTVLHSEIMIQFAELGITGSLLYILFWKRLITNVYRQNMTAEGYSPTTKYMFYLIGVLLFSSTNLFLYSSYSFALMLGLMVLLTRGDVAAYIRNRAVTQNRSCQ